MKNLSAVVAFSVLGTVCAAPFAAELAPNKTHAVLNVTYTNYDDVPQAKKKLVFVGQRKPKNKIAVTTDMYGETAFLIPREDTYTILCESLTGPYECGETPYVSNTASTGGITVLFDDTRAELTGVNFKAGSAELIPNSLRTLDNAIAGLKRNAKAKVEIEGHTSSEGSDQLNQKLSAGRAFLTQGMEPCILFIDGEFWGQYELTEKVDNKFISAQTEIPSKDICLINFCTVL